MMRPLKESLGQVSPIEAEAIDLLRAAAGHEPPPGQKQRVRARLLQQRIIRRGVFFRPAVVLPGILCAAAASAAVGRHWIAETAQSLVSAPAHRPAAKATSSFTRRMRSAGEARAPLISAPIAEIAAIDERPSARGPVAEAPVAEAPVVEAKIVKAKLSSARLRPVLAPQTRESRKTIATASGGMPAEDTGLVFDAMRALRQEGQPARAASLLDEYLRRHPGGGLAEEALALSVEAAVARRDPRARELSAAYMNRYPTGHFRAVIENASRRSAP